MPALRLLVPWLLACRMHGCAPNDPPSAAPVEAIAPHEDPCRHPDAERAGPYTAHQLALLTHWDAHALAIDVAIEVRSELPPLDPRWHEVDDETRARWQRERTAAYAPSRAPVLAALECVGGELLGSRWEANWLQVQMPANRARALLWQPNVVGWSGETLTPR